MRDVVAPVPENEPEPPSGPMLPVLFVPRQCECKMGYAGLGIRQACHPARCRKVLQQFPAISRALEHLLPLFLHTTRSRQTLGRPQARAVTLNRGQKIVQIRW